MTGPMEGIKVVELGFWVAGPAAGGVLADWGADVVKIEPHDGDPLRGFVSAYADLDVSPPFELDNRGKRSICLDLSTETGKAIAGRLVDGADVFLSNMRQQALERMGFDYQTLSERNSRLVYASVTGYGISGPDVNRAAFDLGAFWARSGVARALTVDGDTPPLQRGGMGDHMTGMATAGGIAAALLARERTGRGQHVSTSLMRIGAYMLGWDLNSHLRTGFPTTAIRREQMPNPIVTTYQAGDGEWFWLLCLQGDRHWPDVVAAIDRPELEHDERFATLVDRMQNCTELVKLLDGVFAQRTRAEWGPIFDRHDVWWAPVQSVDDLVHDEQARHAGVFVDVPMPDGSAEMVATPVDFSETSWAPRAMPPELGQHTEEVLLELGYDWEDVAGLAGDGVIP